MCSLCLLPVAKPQLWAVFDICMVLLACADSLLPMKAKFGVLEQTQGLHLHAKFHLNVFIASASGGQNHNFGQILTFVGLLYRPPLPTRAKFSALKQTHDVRLRVKFRLDIGLFCRPLPAKTPNFYPFLDFGIL